MLGIASMHRYSATVKSVQKTFRKNIRFHSDIPLFFFDGDSRKKKILDKNMNRFTEKTNNGGRIFKCTSLHLFYEM